MLKALNELFMAKKENHIFSGKQLSHVSWSSGLAKTILQGTVKGKRKRGRQKGGGKTISKSGQEWTLPAQLGQLKTGQDGKGLL